MAEQLTIEAELRDSAGGGTARRLRRIDDKVPAVVYGANEPSQTLMLDYRRVNHAMQEEAFYSQIMLLRIGESSQQVVLRELQRNPQSERVIHLDFLRVREDRELQLSVPIHFENEEDCIGVRNSGGVITRILTEVEISCLPRHLPEYLSIDLADLDLGDSIHLSDLSLPEGVTIVALAHGEERDSPIVSVQIPRGVAEEEEIAAEDELELLDEAAEGEEPSAEGTETEEDDS